MWIDIAWIILILIGLIRGWQQGLIISVFSTLAWVIGMLAALKLCHVTAIFLEKQFDLHSNYLPVISFVVVFIIIAILIYLFGKSLENVVKIVHLGVINKISGAILRAVIFTFLFSTFLWLINEAGLVSPEVKAQSKTYSVLSPVSEWVIDQIGLVLPFVKDLLEKLRTFFENTLSGV